MKAALFFYLLHLLAALRVSAAEAEYDVVVSGATAPGIIAAVRAAREGLKVALVARGQHLGGSLPSLGALETHYAGKRAPLLDEFADAVKAHYRDRYGADSEASRVCSAGRMITFEPKVAESLLERLVAGGQRITLHRGFVPVRSERTEALLSAVEFASTDGAKSLRLTGRAFVEASDEGDLMAATGVRHRIGRESRAEFGESRAGRVFTRWLTGQYPREAVEGRLKLVTAGATTSEPLPGSTGEGDDNIQSYSFRLCVTDDPANRRLLTAPPAGYDRTRYAPILLSPEEKARLPLPFHHRFLIYPLREMVERDHIFHGHALPNRKRSWNATNLTGGGKEYPAADEAQRRVIAREHLDHALGLMWFLQNDSEMPADLREQARAWGLAKDEFITTENLPPELYVREARRLVGRSVFTENDALDAPALVRAPVHAEAIGITEFSLDSLACTTERLGDSLCDGQLFQMEVSRPAQVPWGALLPRELDNLAVVTTLSATHVGWGTARQTPTQMHLAESAAWAIVLAARAGIPLARLPADRLQRHLCEHGIILTFFNDVDVTSNDPRAAAAQYFGTKGFFADYNARLDEPLTESVRNAWGKGLAAMREGTLKPMELVKAVREAEAAGSKKLERTRGDSLLSMWKALAEKKVQSAAAKTVRVPLKVVPVRSRTAGEVDGRAFDLVVVGGTPGGITCAVRAAREGLSVLLVQHNKHIGGMLTNGLMQWDALYGGPRSPVFNEYAKMIEDYYRETYGEDSKEYAQARYSQTHYPMSRFEPSVAEHLFNQLVSAEKNITTLLSHYPAAVEREGGLLKAMTLREYGTTTDIRVSGGTFVDATYEGDLAALAKVPYRVGRESRAEFGEPHAGKVFTNIESKKGPKDVLEGKLNLHTYAHVQGSIDPTSPFTADGAIQAYNHRFCLSNEPGNIRLPAKPPGYNREEYVNYNRKGMGAGAMNGKSSFNSAILPGENHAYPEATWPEREKIIARHTNFALGLMYFLQNDESVSEAKRAEFRRIGLPLDEFPDNHNLPYEMYVREARRIVGRYVFTEHDNMPAPGQTRPPVHADSIAFTDWSMDSHDCTNDRRPGYDYDGKLILTEESRPAQVPYRCLLPKDIDNLLVPVCLSATHVAWGAVRLEPVWMQTGEAAGFAAALSKKHQTTPGKLDPDLLVRTLVTNRHFVTFFNDLEAAADHAAMPAAQYFGTKTFFESYDARLDEPLTEGLKAWWQEGFKNLESGRLKAAKWQLGSRTAEAGGLAVTDQKRGVFLQGLWRSLTP